MFDASRLFLRALLPVADCPRQERAGVAFRSFGLDTSGELSESKPKNTGIDCGGKI
jgi:hypothetical protein